MSPLSIRSKNPIKQGQLLHLRKAIQNGPVLITTHDNPDPDALAAGEAINHLINLKWGIPTKLIVSAPK
jgi:nanoRNase/pAp phosphatase (c-di-AMP/oligoRNAs hydrolase)